MTVGDVAVVIAASSFTLGLDQGLMGPAFIEVGVHHLDNCAASRRCGFEFDDGHD
jgi:hypothetical protein